MVIYRKLLPRTKKRGVFYLSLKISSLNRLASYDEYPPACGKGVKIPLRGEGAGSSVCYTLPRPSPRRSVLFYTNSNMVTLRSWSTPLLQEEHAYRSLTDTIQLLSLLSPSLITRSLI